MGLYGGPSILFFFPLYTSFLGFFFVVSLFSFSLSPLLKYFPVPRLSCTRSLSLSLSRNMLSFFFFRLSLPSVYPASMSTHLVLVARWKENIEERSG